jgi:hypothetical protein
MSTITAPGIRTTFTLPQRSRRAVTLVASAIIAVAAAITLTVVLLVQSPTHHAKVTSPPQTTVQKLGVAGQGGNTGPAVDTGGAPAPGKRLC